MAFRRRIGSLAVFAATVDEFVPGSSVLAVAGRQLPDKRRRRGAGGERRLVGCVNHAGTAMASLRLAASRTMNAGIGQ